MRKTTRMLLAMVLAATALPADAGTATEPAASAGVQRLQYPLRGMFMDNVENIFGAPQRKLPPVGEPPISRWEYPGYTVYFEGNRVIHTVVTSS